MTFRFHGRALQSFCCRMMYSLSNKYRKQGHTEKFEILAKVTGLNTFSRTVFSGRRPVLKPIGRYMYTSLHAEWYAVVQLLMTLRQSPSNVRLQNTPAQALAASSYRPSPLPSHRAVSVTSQRVVSRLSLRTATLGFPQFSEKWQCIGKFKQAKLEAQ